MKYSTNEIQIYIEGMQINNKIDTYNNTAAQTTTLTQDVETQIKDNEFYQPHIYLHLYKTLNVSRYTVQSNLKIHINE